MKEREKNFLNWGLTPITAIITAIGAFMLFKFWIIPDVTYSASMLWTIFLAGWVATIASAICDEIVNEYYDHSYFATIVTGGITVLVLIVMIVSSIISSKMVHANEYKETIKIEEGTVMPQIEVGNLPIVDEEAAIKIANRLLGTLPSDQISLYEVADEAEQIIYRGFTYFVCPLEYGGYLKYSKAKDRGIPGYVLVNVSTQEGVFVREKRFYYSPSASFDNKLKRHIQKSYKGFVGESHFEIDEEGNPYFVTEMLQKTAGAWGNRMLKGIVVTDANGNNNYYELDNVPEWVDTIYTHQYLFERIENNYELVNGYWNSVFSKSGVRKLSYQWKDATFTGYSQMMIDGEIYSFTDVVSAGRDESMFGFVLCNNRTGEVTFYTESGVEESTAQEAVENLYKDMQYKATYPVIISVDGVTTYFMLLRDSSLIVHKYAFVNANTHSIAVAADTIGDALTMYRKALTGSEVNAENVQILTASGVVEEIFTAVIDGNTYYFYTLAGNDMLFMSPVNILKHQVQFKVGDKLVFTYVISDEESNLALVTSIKQ